MTVTKTDLLFTIFGVIACLGMPDWVSSQQVDITALVKTRNPTFDLEIKKICEESCLGNERRGWLHAVSYSKIDDKNYRVHVETRFRNRHHMDPIYVLGTKVSEEGDLFDHTVIVKSKGRIDKQTCVAVVEEIWVENDFRGIFAAKPSPVHDQNRPALLPVDGSTA